MGQGRGPERPSDPHSRTACVGVRAGALQYAWGLGSTPVSRSRGHLRPTRLQAGPQHPGPPAPQWGPVCSLMEVQSQRLLFRVQHATHGARDPSPALTPSRAQDPDTAHTHSSRTTHFCAQSTPHTTCVHKAPPMIHTHTHSSSSDAHTHPHTSKCPGDKIIQIPGAREPPREGEMCFHPSSDSLLSTWSCPELTWNPACCQRTLMKT